MRDNAGVTRGTGRSAAIAAYVVTGLAAAAVGSCSVIPRLAEISAYRKNRATLQRMHALVERVEGWKQANGRVPAEAQMRGGLLSDAWETPIRYRQFADRSRYAIASAGADGQFSDGARALLAATAPTPALAQRLFAANKMRSAAPRAAGADDLIVIDGEFVVFPEPDSTGDHAPWARDTQCVRVWRIVFGIAGTLLVIAAAILWKIAGPP